MRADADYGGGSLLRRPAQIPVRSSHHLAGLAAGSGRQDRQRPIRGKGFPCWYDKKGMTKRFRPWDPKQKWLLPPEITEFIPEGHPAHFVRDLVVEELDLTAILDTYVEDKGFPPFHPAMMTGLLLYAYTQGVFSSRKIAKACLERMDFAAVTGFQKPDFRTISLFRKRHLNALGGLFQQVLVLCRQAGLVALGHVALDGTKVKANASKHKAMSYDRMVKAETEFAEVVKGWLDQAEITDLGEDYRFRNRQGDELPAWVANKAERMKKIRAAKAALEQEAITKAKEGQDQPKKKAKKKDDDEDPPPPPQPEPKAQRNFTDPESRIMPTKNGFEQCYNAQAGVDAQAQVIVACEVVNTSADCPQLLAMVDQVRANLGASPRPAQPMRTTVRRPTWRVWQPGTSGPTSRPGARSTVPRRRPMRRTASREA